MTCKATKKDGSQCKGRALDNGYCFAHQPKGEQIDIEKVTAQPEPEVKYCGHINRHSIGAGGEPDNLACDLPEGHEGNHSAVHQEIHYLKGKVIFDDYGRVEWTDAAGTPPELIVPKRDTMKHNRFDVYDPEWENVP